MEGGGGAPNGLGRRRLSDGGGDGGRVRVYQDEYPIMLASAAYLQRTDHNVIRRVMLRNLLFTYIRAIYLSSAHNSVVLVPTRVSARPGEHTPPLNTCLWYPRFESVLALVNMESFNVVHTD